MRITQSISLSNIQTFALIGKARPWAVETCRTSFCLAGLLPNRGHRDDGDWEAVNEFWWS